METTQVPTKKPRQNPKPSSFHLSLKPVSGVLLPAGCVLPHAHSSCQGGSSFSGCLQRENTLLSGVPKESVMSGPWICPSSLRTCFTEVCKVPWAVSAVILLPFQGNLATSFVSTQKESLDYSLFLKTPFQFQIPFVTGFVLKCSHSHGHIFPDVPAGLYSFILSLPLALCSASYRLFFFPGLWTHASPACGLKPSLFLLFIFF